MPASGRPPFLEHRREFDLFGSHVSLLIGRPAHGRLPAPEAMALQLEGFLRGLHRRLTRFDPESELCSLNADPAESRQVSSALAAAVDAAVGAARRSRGLVDPTLVSELETAGYRTSRVGLGSAPIRAALAAAPARRPARARRGSAWTRIELDHESCLVRRPHGVRIDTGGTGKDLAADLAAVRLTGYESFAVDAGGDLRLGGTVPPERIIRVDHPVAEGPARELLLARGAVATSGIRTRLWRTAEGFAHHLLDPSTGEPAWTGVIQATALARTAVEAETLAKAAFLSGPKAAEEVLSPNGGLIVLDDGSVEGFGALESDACRSVSVAA